MLVHRIERRPRGFLTTPATHQLARFGPGFARTQAEDDAAFLPGTDVERHAQRGARIERRTEPAGEPRLRQRRRRGQRAAGTEKIASVCARAAFAAFDIEEGDATLEVGVVRIAGKECARLFVKLGDDLHLRFAAFVAEHPIETAGDAQTTRLT